MTSTVEAEKRGPDERKLLLAGTGMFVVLGLAASTGVAHGAAVGVAAAVFVVAVAVALGNTWAGLLATVTVYTLAPLPVINVGSTAIPPGRMLTFLLVIGWFLQRRRRDVTTHLRRTPLDGAMLFFLISMIAALLANMTRMSPFELAGAFRRIFLFGIDYVLLFWIATSVLTSRERILKLTRLIAGVIVIAAFYGVYEKITGKGFYEYLTPFFGQQVRNFLNDVGEAASLPRAGLNRVHSTIGHPIAFGAALLLGLPLAIVCRFIAESRRAIIFWTIGIGLIGASMLFTVSRQVYLIAPISIIVLAALIPSKNSRLVIAALSVILVAGLFVQSDIRMVALSFVGRGELQAPSIEGRTSDYAPVIKLVEQRPLFGYGPRTFAADSLRQNKLLTNERNIVLDNAYLARVAETGLVGLVALLGLMLTAMIAAYRMFRRSRDPELALVGLGCMVSVLCWTLQTGVADVYTMVSPPRLFFLILAIIAAGRRLSGWPGNAGFSHREPRGAHSAGATTPAVQRLSI